MKTLNALIILIFLLGCNTKSQELPKQALTPDNAVITDPKVSKAMQWIKSQLEPLDIETKAKIILDREYEYDYKGTISGSVTISDDDLITNDLVLILYAITDHPYEIHRIPFPKSGKFSFPSSQIGCKRVRLLSSKTHEAYAQTTSSINLIRSYQLLPGDPVVLYL